MKNLFVITNDRIDEKKNFFYTNSSDLENILGKSFCSIYKCLKRYEAEAFLQVISPWEREHLLLNV